MLLQIFLAINWSEVGLLSAQLLLSLSILVILHEFGHYITAKWFKCRVEKFFLFFDAGFALVKKKIGETVYGIGWLPLGGYVKIAGMVDESMDKDQLNKPAEPWEFRSKPAWQRLIIMLGGVTVNILLAIIIYGAVAVVWGEKKLDAKSMKYGISFNDSVFNKMGFVDGDKILAIDDKPVDDFQDAIKRLVVVDKHVTIERNGAQQKLNMPVDLIGKLVERKKAAGSSIIGPRIPVIVLGVDSSSNAYKAGLRQSDKILSLNNKPVPFSKEFTAAIKNVKKGDSINLVVERNGSQLAFTSVAPQNEMVGFSRPTSPQQYDSLGIYKYTVTKASLAGAIPAGLRIAGRELVYYIQQFGKILNPKTGGYKAVGGFKNMANVFSRTGWDWEQFWTMTALFSVILAFMNLLPIPALDGGHVLFTLIEMATGKKPNQKVLEYAQMGGMIILLALMLYANFNDWFGYGKGK